MVNCVAARETQSGCFVSGPLVTWRWLRVFGVDAARETEIKRTVKNERREVWLFGLEWDICSRGKKSK